MVGALLVHKNRIIGEGFTSPYGGAHAEVNAINSVADPELLKEATLYVTLEPCSHFGKTPPCSLLIIEKQIPKVVIGIRDPHDLVAGKGITQLKQAGCEVVVGVLEAECREHHKRFLTPLSQKRPYIVLKWAQTQDGFLAPDPQLREKDPKPYWITNPLSRQRVHQWRSEEQAILVGTQTVLEDNPKLDVREWTGQNPIRVVLDRSLKIGAEHHVLDGSTKTIALTEQGKTPPQQENIVYLQIPFDDRLAQHICNALYDQKINSVLIEGGARTLSTFLKEGLWDEARVFTGNTRFGKGIPAPLPHGQLVGSEKLGTDTLNIYHP